MKWYFAALLALVFLAAFLVPQSKNFAEDFEGGTGRWLSSTGTIQSVKDPSNQRPGKVLEWKYEIPKKAVFVANQDLLGRFAGAQGISFWIRSDREAEIFFRVDLTDGGNWIVSFPVTQQWQAQSFRFEQFLKAEKKGGPLDPAKIRSVLFADLSGEHKKLTGSRTLWIDDVQTGPAGDTPSVPAQGAQAGPAGNMIEDFESGSANWIVSDGAIRTVADPLHERPGKVLEWNFEIPRKPAFVGRQQLQGRFAGAERVSAWMRSDREGLVFIRLDLTDGSNWIVSFTVTPAWQQVSFRFDQFITPTKATSLDASRIKSFTFADLSGEQKLLSGKRTIWIDDLSTGSPGGRADAGFILKGYKPDGSLVSYQELKSYGISGFEYAFATDLEGFAVPCEVESAHAGGLQLTKMVTPPGKPVVLNILYWTVPDYGKLWLLADNAGAGNVLPGPGSSMELNLNYEFARTRVAMLEKSLASGKASPEIQRRMSGVRSLLEQAAGQRDDRQQARLSDQVLAQSLRLGDDLEMEEARRKIETNRKGALTVTVVDAAGRPVPNAQVTFRQKSSDFFFSCAEGLGFADQSYDDRTLDQITTLMQEAGFNHFPVSLFWDRIEPKEGQYVLDQWDKKLALSYFARKGFTFRAHSIMQHTLPPYMKDMSPSRLRVRVQTHFSHLIERYNRLYPGLMVVWQAINEPSANQYTGLTMQEKIVLIRDTVGVIRRLAPQSKIAVNDYDWDRGQRFKKVLLAPSLKDVVAPYDFFALLDRNNISYDINAVQWWPGLRVYQWSGKVDQAEPFIDLAHTSLVLDRYDRLGKAVHISEFAVPGTHQPGWRNGYWHQPWNPSNQAEFAAAFFTLAFSKPYVHEVTYWGITDHEPWAASGGLLGNDLRPKPVYSNLKQLILSWRSSGVETTDSRGVLRVKGFGGNYTIEAKRGTGGGRAEAHITERENAAVTIHFSGAT